MFKKHPSGLPYLFFTEMWERFGYYLMIGIFTLYLKDTVENGGFELSEGDASSLYGTFIALVFLTPFLGGLLADRVLGYRLSITIGGILMGVGYCLMGIPNISMVYLAMTLVILGNGFFKPNISTLLGNLYNDPQYKEHKDSGYNIFYMGINIGAFVCNFFGAAMQNIFGWTEAFMTAGIGMFIGIAIFWIGTRHYAHADVKKPVQANDMSLMRILALILLPSIVFACIGALLPITLVKDKSTDAFLFACIPVVFFYVTLFTNATPEERKPIAAMLVIFAVSIPFWAVFKQNGSALNTWADRYTDRELPAGIAPLASSVYLCDTIPMKLGKYPRYDSQFRVAKADKGPDGKPIKYDLYPPYYLNMAPDQIPAEGGDVKVWSPNLSQSINPAWVVMLTPVVVGFFGMMRRRGKEPSTASKLAWGLAISAMAMFCMIGAAYVSDNGALKSSVWWLIGTYGVITVGELCLSPMGLSLVSKLSPPRLTSLMMGGWFLSTSIGNKLSGVLASMWDGYDTKSYFFMVNIVLLGAAAVIMFLLLRWLNAIFREYVK